MTHFIEHEGEILPAYTGVNEPHYRNRIPVPIDEMPHPYHPTEEETISDEPVATEVQVAEIVVPNYPEEPQRWGTRRAYYLSQEQKSIGRAGIAAARSNLEG